MRWDREEIQVLIVLFHGSSFSIGDDERDECKAIAKAFGRTPSAVDRQWRNIADVKSRKSDLRVTKLIPECLSEYLDDPVGYGKLAKLICNQRQWFELTGLLERCEHEEED